MNVAHKVQFNIEVVKEMWEFLDLKFTFDEGSKHIFVDIFSKGTNSFTYVFPSTFFQKNLIENILKDVKLR